MEVGPSGAFAPEVLAKLERKKVRRELRHPSALSLETLLPQVEQWMGDWIPGINIRAESSEDANRASVRFRHKGIKSEWKRPANVGFGASYSLPIVLTGLLAPRGSIIIVDTPEAHLHPAGQAAMAKFLSQVSASGVQVIIETHSDHIINGIRICAADKSHPLEPHDVVINSLAQAPEAVKIEKIEINEYGSLNKWPKGFLDQTEMDLAAISRIARGL
jgi:predicted ATPase